ncbi:hypothetical protein GGF50DRAFT_60369 [Schizophyllum commune]
MSPKKSRGKSKIIKPVAGPKPPRDQYHHALPRFILRRYQVGPALTSAERTKALKRNGFIPEYVRYYDVSARTLEIRPIGEVYGVTNLYRDIRNMGNANHIEEKLARLEQKAATTITLIHNSIPDGAFNISRAELGNLRKFLFTMHVRHDACSREYFDQDHPGNARSREFLQAYMDKYGFHTSEELWLYFMNYLLDTPHEQIMQDGDMLLPPQPTAADVEILKKFYAISYQQQATLYFLGVWEAADTDEFVLTSSSFGLHEGCLKTNRRVMLHRLFVISPRLVVVLRVTALRDPQGPDYERFWSDCLTRLGNLNLVPPKPSYTHTPAGLPGSQAFADYVLSDAGQRDNFTITITKLTSEETSMVNKVTLENTKADGSLTFYSPSLTVRTLRRYLRRLGPWEERAGSYHTLLEHLVPPPNRHEMPFEGLMSLILEAVRPESPRSWYSCGLAIVRDMPHLVGQRSPRDMAFGLDYGVCVLALLFHLYSRVPSEPPSVVDFLPTALPSDVSCDASTRLINAARPLLRAAAPGCVCSANSSHADRVLEATVIVGVLEAAIADVRLRIALHDTYPHLADYLSVRAGSQLLRRDRERITRDLNDLTVKMYRGNIPAPSRYERASTLRAYYVVLREEDHDSAAQYAETVSKLVEGLELMGQTGPPSGFGPRPRARPKTRLSSAGGDLLMSRLSGFLALYGFRLTDMGLDDRERTATLWLHDAVIFGVLGWMVKNRCGLLDALFIQPGSGFASLSDFMEDE